MSLLLDIEQNLPPPIIVGVNAAMQVPVHRVGNFYADRMGQGCGTACFWNGGGYYMDEFLCGDTYPSGLTFYCCSDCHSKVGTSEKVFLSYRWCDAELADHVANCARGAGIEIVRDVNEVDFFAAISSFMDTAAESRYFVAIMTESYFYSRFCMYELRQLCDSDQPIRTIAVMLGAAAEPATQRQIVDYWRSKHAGLKEASRGIDDRYTEYLRPELDLLASIPSLLEQFYASWCAKPRPAGKRWMIANCRYLVGAIKTTFKPSEEDASNWTYSNKTVRGERALDAPRAAQWLPKPFYLHASSESEAQGVLRQASIGELVLGVDCDGMSHSRPPPGIHVLMISVVGLRSMSFCRFLVSLMERHDVQTLPIFRDEDLRMPGSEVELLRYWQTQLDNAESHALREQVEGLLSRFGPMMERLRDSLVPGIASIFEGSR